MDQPPKLENIFKKSIELLHVKLEKIITSKNSKKNFARIWSKTNIGNSIRLVVRSGEPHEGSELCDLFLKLAAA